MTSRLETIRASASDFGSYVYCGAKLFLDKSPELDSFRKAKHGSYDIGQNTISRIRGQQNEHKCIEWILGQHGQPQSVIFDGTGRDNQQFFPANIEPLGIVLQCRPDLIIKKSGWAILYEFKAVGNHRYLRYPEYDPVHAQVWCYSFIKHFKIDKYYLFRYYEDPFIYGAFPEITELTTGILDDKKFIPLFTNYASVIETLNNARKTLKNIYKLDLTKLNRPVNQPDKCHHCIYYDIYCKPDCPAIT